MVDPGYPVVPVGVVEQLADQADQLGLFNLAAGRTRVLAGGPASSSPTSTP